MTDPVDVTLGGHAGKYLDLQVPSDPTIQGDSQPASQEGCPVYRPWEPWYLAQAPGERWHLWVLDVDGVRVVVQAMDREGTSPEVEAQLQGIVDSIAIESPPTPLHQGTLSAGTYTVAPFGGEEWAPCGPSETPCPEAARDDDIRFTFRVPDGWAGAPFGSDIWLADAANSGPCRSRLPHRPGRLAVQRPLRPGRRP